MVQAMVPGLGQELGQGSVPALVPGLDPVLGRALVPALDQGLGQASDPGSGQGSDPGLNRALASVNQASLSGKEHLGLGVFVDKACIWV